MEKEEEQVPTTGKYTWKIPRFTQVVPDELFSDRFTAGGCMWRLLVHPDGKKTDHLSLFLVVADAAALPDGWHVKADFTLSLVNEAISYRSTKKNTNHKFCSTATAWGYRKFKTLIEVLDPVEGYLVNDTLVIEAEITVLNVAPVNLSQGINRFQSHFTTLSKYFGDSDSNSQLGQGSNTDEKTDGFTSDAPPSADDIDKAKQSWKECLSDRFRPNMREKLSSTMSVLSHERAGLSPDQQSSIREVKANFDGFVGDLLTVEQDKYKLELQKIGRDQSYSTMKKNYDALLSCKRSFDSLTEEKEELNKRLKEINSREEKLVCDREMLVNESEKALSKYTTQVKEVAEAEKNKKATEERMSNSIGIWSSLKEQFL